jgi:cyclic pyranopterin phosphate synthase
MSQVDVSEKNIVRREAVAEGHIRLKNSTIELIRNGAVAKGDPITMAKIGGILGAKSVPMLLPLCHQLLLDNVSIDVYVEEASSSIKVTSRVVSHAKTGVEMEALTAVMNSLLNIWDMVKQYEKDEKGEYPTTEIYGVKVLKKTKEI